jgi:hypothetical protein
MDEINIIAYRTVNKGIVYALRKYDFMTFFITLHWLNVLYLSHFTNIALL